MMHNLSRLIGADNENNGNAHPAGRVLRILESNQRVLAFTATFPRFHPPIKNLIFRVSLVRDFKDLKPNLSMNSNLFGTVDTCNENRQCGPTFQTPADARKVVYIQTVR